MLCSSAPSGLGRGPARPPPGRGAHFFSSQPEPRRTEEARRKKKMRSTVLLVVLLSAALAPGYAWPVGSLIRRLANEHRQAQEEAGASAIENSSCPEGLIDDDVNLSQNPMASAYGLSTCSQAYDMLTQYMGSADLLCKSLGAGLCNCTCAGTEIRPSIKIDAVPFDGTASTFGGEEDENLQFGCTEKGARLLPFYTQEWHCSKLGDDVGIVLWEADEASNKVTFAAEFVAEGEGGAGIGISANGGMFGSDLLTVYKEDNGEWILKDMFGEGYAEDGSLVTIDPSQDGTLEWVEEDEDRLAFVVSRPIKSCDKDYDMDILPGVVPFIWARFPESGHVYHGPDRQSRGTVYLNLLEDKSESSVSIPEGTSDLFTVDLRMLNEAEEQYMLPNGQVNTYACRSFELPSDQPYHIVSYEAILDTADTTSDVVHHIVMYSCDEDASTPDPQECGSMAGMCQMVEIAWAVGMPPQYLPDLAGIPLKKYVLLEVHYENLAEEENIRDGSGIRLTITPQLRKHDFGYLIVGTDLGRTPALEPDRSDLVRSGYCPADCLARHLPESGVQVHGQFFHAHLLGRSLYTQLLRGGEEMPHLGTMKHYDFNFQHFKYYGRNEQRLMPGDTLVTTCMYNTKGMAKTTTFGLETTEEMCYNVIGLFPAIPLQFCWNSTASGGYCMGENGFLDGKNVESPLPRAIPYIDPEQSRCAANDAESAGKIGNAASGGELRNLYTSLPLLGMIICAASL